MDPHTEDDTHQQQEEGNVMLAKSVTMCVLFMASFTMGMLPVILAKWCDWKTNVKNRGLVPFLLCIGGGTLMCTTFLHLLPEVSENLLELQEQGRFPDFGVDVGPFLMCAGFFVIYFVEECVHAYLERMSKEDDGEIVAFRRTLSIRRGELDGDKKDEIVELPPPVSAGNKKDSMAYLVDSELYNSRSSVDHGHSHSHGAILEESVMRSIRGLFLVLVLSVHELFEGLAIGLEPSPALVWYMFGAVSAHKLVIAFCIGVELVATQSRLSLTVLYAFTFAVVSPIGIGVGIVLSGDYGHTTDVISVVLQGLASGTLLYVVFFEILQDRRNGLTNYSAVVIGFGIMLLITRLSKYSLC